jgi:hypothetical protein
MPYNICFISAHQYSVKCCRQQIRMEMRFSVIGRYVTWFVRTYFVIPVTKWIVQHVTPRHPA